ncbi:MAG TPA: 50S ribosomal protein L4 [Anaerolineae bacterium]|nr:50S ribosomal protein L4 [Anaerolineae bacterium]
MEVNVINMQGKKVDKVDLPAEIFEASINVDLMHQAYVRQMANARLGTHSTKSRGEVSGGGRKPWRQKGTGRARQGSIRAPNWVGGGKVHTPRPHSHDKKMPRNMRRAALRSALSVKASAQEVVVVDELKLAEAKTRQMADALNRMIGDSSALILIPENNETYEMIRRSTRNIPDAKIILASYLNVRDLLGFDKVILPIPSLEVIKNYLG